MPPTLPILSKLGDAVDAGVHAALGQKENGLTCVAVVEVPAMSQEQRQETFRHRAICIYDPAP
jgi:hypothetical protein